MKKMLASDSSLKIISFIVAIIIWIYIAIVMDPAIEVSIRAIPIQFVGSEQLAENGLAVISESATTVSVKIKGSRKKMGSYDKKTIIAKADVSNALEGTNHIAVNVVVPFENQGITSQSVKLVDVKVETISEKSLPLNAYATGTLAEGYMSGDIETEPRSVTVRGAASAVEKFSKATLKLDVSDADVDIDIDTELPIIFLDEKNKEITALDAIFKRVSVSVDKIKVHCPVFKIREITPTVLFDEAVPEGFSYKIEPSILYIYGEEAGSTKIDKIETEYVSLSKLMENDKIKAKLVIPGKVKILNDISEIEITVNK